MLDVTAALQHLNIHTKSIAAAVRSTGEKFEGDVDNIALGKKLVKQLIGVDVAFTDPNMARLTTMALAEAAVRGNGVFEDEATAFKIAHERAAKHMATHQWMYIKSETIDTSEVKAVAEGIDTKVAVKANGKIKKGGKQILAAELYKKHVLEATTPQTNQEFIATLMKQLDMSKPGATTYAYNCKKELGEPKGGIVKAAKGRKKKAV